MRSVGPKRGSDCGMRMGRFLEPCLLLLLSRQPSHGYELLGSLVEFGFSESQDPGMVYRILRRLEDQEMIVSSWDTSGRGPARRIYEVTELGKKALKSWALSISRTVERFELFLSRYKE